MPKHITMTKPEAVKEHSKLVKVLHKGKRSELKQEARKQSRELAKYRRH